MKSFGLTIGLLAGLTLIAASTWGMDYQHKIEVKDIVFEWQVKDDKLHIQLSAPTTGWVGIGFNPSKGMKDANLILGYVKKDKARVTDHYGTQLRQHKRDTRLGGKDNVTDVKGTEKDGVTTINFTIPLDSGDAQDKSLAPDQDTHILLAYSSGRDSFRTRHKERVELNVNLTTGVFSEKK